MGRSGGDLEARRLSSGREDLPVCKRLEGDRGGRMGDGDSPPRIFSPLRPVSTALSSASRDPPTTGTIKENSTLDRGPVPPREESDRGDPTERLGRRRFLLSLFLGDQENRRVSPNPQPQGVKRLSPRGEIPDGNPIIHPQRPASWSMDGIPRPEGCLPSCSDPPISQKVPEICVEGPDRSPPRLSVEGSPVRTSHGATGVHQVVSPRCGPPSSQDYVYVPIHRRYLSCSGFGRSRCDYQKCKSSHPSPARFHHKPREISSHPYPGDDPSRSVNRHVDGIGPSYDGQDLGDLPVGPVAVDAGLGIGTAPSEVDRGFGSLPCHSPSVSVLAEANIISPGQELQTGQRQPLHKHRFEGSDGHRGSPVLVQPRPCGSGSSTGSSLPKSNLDDGRFRQGLGSGSGWPRRFGSLDQGGISPSCQSAGVYGGFSRSPVLRSEPQTGCNPGSDGQHHRPVVSEPDGRDQVPFTRPPGSRDYSMVFSERHFTESSASFRGRQRRRRSSLPSIDGSSSLLGEVSGVVSRPGDSQPSFSSVGEPSSGSLCYKSKCKGTGFLQPASRTLVLQGRCPASRLVERSALYVPTDSSLTSSPSQGEARGGERRSHPTLVAATGLVSVGLESVGGPASAATGTAGSHSQPSGGGAPGTPNPPISRLAALGESLQAAGVSEPAARTICAAKRQSTRDLYDAKWRVFSRWCAERDFDPLHPSPSQVVDYLEHLASIPLEHNTILTHVSALSSCTYGLQGVSVGLHPLVSAWVHGHKARFPPKKLRVPPWDLQAVLVALTEEPFEPIRKVDLKYLTYKVLFLVSLASARRVSELHALSVEPPFLIENPQSFNLAVNPAFLPKTSTDAALSSDIELEAFHPHPESDLDKLFQRMCPVRALKVYLKRTKESRGRNRALFVHFDPAKAERPISKATLSRWMTEAIKLAYVTLGRENEVIRANPHSIRGVAASWAEFARVSPVEICRAATWSSSCSFARHYRLDFSAKPFASKVLAAATRGRPR